MMLQIEAHMRNHYRTIVIGDYRYDAIISQQNKNIGSVATIEHQQSFCVPLLGNIASNIHNCDYFRQTIRLRVPKICQVS